MGVMVGTQKIEYSSIFALFAQKHEAHAVTSGSLSVSAGRLSFTYGLQGACAAVDTACSSSLVAAHMTWKGLVMGENSKGLACGCEVMVSRDTFASVQRAGMLAPDGRCKTLDASADGYVRAEACISSVLGPLQDGGVVWCGVVWCGVVWFGVVCCGVVWCGVVMAVVVVVRVVVVVVRVVVVVVRAAASAG